MFCPQTYKLYLYQWLFYLHLSLWHWDGVITHLESDILECEVKWALGSTAVNKASGYDGIPVGLFKTLKDDAINVLHSLYQQIWKTQQWPQDWERSILIPIPKKGCTKECSNHQKIAIISMLVRLCSKSCIVGFSITWTKNLQIYKLGLEKVEEPEIKLSTFIGL